VILVVIDPTAEAVELARLLKGEAERIDKPLYAIMNKATPQVSEVMERELAEAGLRILGSVRFDDAIFRSSLEGGPLRADRAMDDIERIALRLRDLPHRQKSR